MEGLEDALSSLPCDFLSPEDKQPVPFSSSLGDEVCTRLSEHSCDGIGGCLSAASFPQEDGAHHLTSTESFALLPKCSNLPSIPAMFAAAVSHHDNNINTLDIFVVSNRECNILEGRSSILEQKQHHLNPSDSIALGEAQTAF